MTTPRLLVPLTLATLAISLVAATPARADDDHLLIFQIYATTHTEIAVAHRDGTEVTTPVADLEGGDRTNPDWSPSGRRFTFPMNDAGTDDLWIARVTGARARMLVDCVAPCLYLDDPAWSPDGRSIVYSRTEERNGAGVSTLETVEVATGRTTTLLGPFTRRFTAGARWSPSGRQIVFEMVRKAGTAVEDDVTGVTLSIVRVGGDHPVRGLTEPTLFAATADWSRDRDWIVYSALPTPTSEAPDLYRVRPWGGDPVRMTRLSAQGGYAAEPTFTPDGKGVIFSGGRASSESDVLLVVRLGSGRVRLATDLELSGRHPRVRDPHRRVNGAAS